MLKINSKLYNLYLNYFGKYFRFPSYPYVSGDTFRDYSDHVYDELSNFYPHLVNEGEKIFVKTDLLEKYFKTHHKEIKNKYYLISHNSDLKISSQYKELIDDKVIFWFAQNLENEFTKKIKIIPIGLENRWRIKNGRLRQFNKYKNVSNNKNVVVLSSFSTKTNPNRNELRDIVENINYIISAESVKTHQYQSLLSKSMFNICPEGNGLDTHRIWESYVMNSIPIVLKNSFTEQFNNLEIPMLYLNSWNDLSDLSEDYFVDLYSKIINQKNIRIYSSFLFWKNYIEAFCEE